MPEQPTNRRPLRVLFIEDSEADVDLCRAALKSAGYEVKPAVVQTQAELRALQGERFDLILSDFRLPGWTGMDAFQMLQGKKDAELRPPFILVTGALGEMTAVECLKEGVSDFVLKDRLDRLPQVVKRALEEQQLRREKEFALDQLRRAHEQLENRVAQRTQELSAVNQVLITEVEHRRRAEDALRESEKQFRLLAEAIPEMVWTARPNGSVDYANRRWFEYTGLWFEQTEGWGWEQALHPADLERTIEQWKKSLESGEAYQQEFRLQRAADGEYRWHLGRGVPLRDPHGEIMQWFGTCTDIHDQKLAQEAQAQLVAMRDDLVANVSHALRTPLASLRGFSELLLTRDFPVEKQREFYTIIHRESNRLTELINNFLDLQRMESGKQNFNFESIDLVGMVRERAAFFSAGDRFHQLRIDIPAALPVVRADAGRMQEVLNNLISNAFKYSPAGGEVVIGGRVSNHEVVLFVADSGIGIPQQAMQHLFHKFYRVESEESRAITGTGLGLATVKQIIELHKGRVWAESSYGEGSTFYIALPFEAAAVSSGWKSPGGEVDSDIVIVEDDKAFAKLLAEHFHGLGITIRQTAFAEEALEWCRKAPPRVLLLDIHLAGVMDGWDLLVTVKNDEVLQKIRIVVMLGSDHNTHGLALAGADYILKTASREGLLMAVQGQITTLRRKRVLVAGDDAAWRSRIVETLREEGAEVAEASGGQETLKSISKQLPDLLILELLMPQMDGFEVLRRLRNDRRAVNLRILVVASRDLRLKEKAYLRRSLATLVGKSDEDLSHFCEVVVRTLGETEREVAEETGISAGQ